MYSLIRLNASFKVGTIFFVPETKIYFSAAKGNAPTLDPPPSTSTYSPFVVIAFIE